MSGCKASSDRVLEFKGRPRYLVGNPLASAVAMASLDVIEEEKLVESSDELREGSRALHDVLEVDLPNLRKINAGKTPVSHLTECDRCGRNLNA